MNYEKTWTLKLEFKILSNFFISRSVYTPGENDYVKLSNITEKVYLTSTLAADLCEEHLLLICYILTFFWNFDLNLLN